MDLDDDGKTWENVAAAAKKSGFRDGIDQGRNSMFQDSFNRGYKDGFKTGFSSGFYKGSLMARKKELHEPLLEKTRHGWCRMCTDNLFLNKPIEEVINIQTNHSENVLDGLRSKYARVMNNVN